MKKLLLLIAICCSTWAWAQTAIKMTTQKEAGEEFTFMVNTGITNCTVDWGNGVAVEVTPVNNAITGTVAGKAVTLKGYNITYLDCSAQGITALAFTKATDLKHLIVSDNSISSLIITSLTNLKTLWCDGNNLKSLNLRYQANLESLVASGNQITSIAVATTGLPALIDCWLDSNLMETLTLKGCTTLKTLNVENNNMTKMTLPVLSAKADQVFLDGNSLDFTSYWNKANALNWYGTTQSFSFANDSYKVGEEFCWDRDIYADNQDGQGITYTNTTYTWYPYTDGVKGNKLTRGAASNADADYSTPNIGSSKHLFTFKRPFDDVQLEIRNSRYTDFLLVSDHIQIIDDTTGINELSAKNNLSFTTERGAIILKADASTPVKIYDAAGRLCWQGKVLNPTRLQLGKGIYIVNNIKVAL